MTPSLRSRLFNKIVMTKNDTLAKIYTETKGKASFAFVSFAFKDKDFKTLSVWKRLSSLWWLCGCEVL